MSETDAASAELRVPPRAYKATLEIVDERTRPGMPPRISQFDLVGRMRSVEIEGALCTTIVDRLVERRDLVRYEHDNSPVMSPRRWIALADRDRLFRWIRVEARTDDPDTDLIGQLNDMRQRLEADDAS